MAESYGKAVLITALPIERTAVVEHLHDVRDEQHPRGSVYRRGVFDENSQPWDVLVAEIGAGNEGAAAEANRTLEFFTPEVAMFVGVAGAVKDLQRGSVVAATEVHQYEYGKDRKKYFEVRPKAEQSSYSLLERARYEAGQPDWRRRIKAPPSSKKLDSAPFDPQVTLEGTPEAAVGPIAAGSKILASNRTGIYSFLRQHYGDVVAVEMEGFGFLRGVRMNHPIHGIVVRGISDSLADKTPEADLVWQPRAARHAAAFAFQLLATFGGGATSAGGGPEENRKNLLNSALRASIGRCVERWQALGVPREIAMQLADDFGLGSPEESLVPTSSNPLRILLGELGLGKSLRLERWHQENIRNSIKISNSPVPVYLEAGGLGEPLEVQIERHARGLGDWRNAGVALALDRIERAGPEGAEDLLRDTRRLVASNTNSLALLASRPLFRLEVDEVARPNELSQEEAANLISKFASREVGPWLMDTWPQSLQSAVRLPLFAILTGLDLCRRSMGFPSVGGLIARLVERALRNHPLSDERALQRLAAACIDSGYASVRLGDIGAPQLTRAILDSALVIVRNQAVRFSVDLLTDWFAAHALANKEINIEDVCRSPQRLERWRYALAIAAGVFPHGTVSSLMKPLASAHPAFASQVVDEGMTRFAPADAPELPAAPPPSECGERIREAMAAWGAGLGPVATLVAPFTEDSRLLPVGVLSNGPWILVSWNELRPDLPAVNELSRADLNDRASNGWFRSHSARPATASAWAWSWTLMEISGRIKEIINRRRLPVLGGPLLAEEVWRQALVLTRMGGHYTGSFSLDALRNEAQRFGPRSKLMGFDGESYDFVELKREIDLLTAMGKTKLECPWPGGDRPGGRFVWNPYSPTRLCERATAVFDGAIRAYDQLVTTYFPRFIDRLQIAGLMPVHLIGTFLSLDPGEGEYGPWLRWHFEPLATGSQNKVTINFGQDAIVAATKDDNFAIHSLLKERRPESWKWLRITLTQELLNIFKPTPATDIAYKWLENDLKEVHWLN